MAAKNTESKTEHNLMSQNDVLLFLDIIRGNFDKNRYPNELCSFRNEDNWVAKIVIYAEFDRIYKVEHIDCRQESNKYMYKRINPESLSSIDERVFQMSQNNLLSEFEVYINDKNTIWLTQEDYFGILSKSTRLQSKFENTSKNLRRIIDSSFVGHSPKKAKNREILIIKRTGKGSSCITYYKLIDPNLIDNYVSIHFHNESNDNILKKVEKFTQGDIERSGEIISKLTESSNKSIVEKVKSFEDYISNKISEDVDNEPLSYENTILSIIKRAIYLIYNISTTRNLTSIFSQYIGYISNCSDAIEDHGLLTLSVAYHDLLKQSIEDVINSPCNISERIYTEHRFVMTDFIFQIKNEVETQCNLLRTVNSIYLPDALFTYAVICYSIKDFATADKCLKDCCDIYDTNVSPKSLVVYLLHCELLYRTNQFDKVIKIGNEAIKRLRGFNTSLNIYSAIFYNYISISYGINNVYDKAEKYNIKAAECLENIDVNCKYAFILAYNHYGLRIMQDDYKYTLPSLQMSYSLLKEKLDDSLEFLHLKGLYENLLALCAIHENIDYKTEYINKCIDTYDAICNSDYNKYALSRLFSLQTMAEMFNELEQIKDAEKYYKIALKEAEIMIESGIYITRVNIYYILSGLAGAYFRCKNYDCSIKYSILAIEACDYLVLIDKSYIINKISLLDSIAQIYYSQGKINEALQSCLDALALCNDKDSIECEECEIESWRAKIEQHKHLIEHKL